MIQIFFVGERRAGDSWRNGSLLPAFALSCDECLIVNAVAAGERHGAQAAACGEMIVVRYADDFVTGFEFQDDAVRFLAALKERLGKFALELHGVATRLG